MHELTMPQHFLTLSDLSVEQSNGLLARALELKSLHNCGIPHKTLEGKVLTMIFEKSSTRTRLSFEAGMIQLGGHAIYLGSRDSQMGRGEPLSDTFRVISSMTDGIMIRTFAHQILAEAVQSSSVPVINGLTDEHHPCQLLADLMTLKEVFGSLDGLTVSWFGDFNNMTRSYVEAAQLFNFKLRVCAPEAPPAGTSAEYTPDVKAAAENADAIVTDVWASMGQESERADRIKHFNRYQVNKSVMQLANKSAIFLHCLPAHRGEEVTAEVIDGTQSVVWQEAENRLHTQKALLELLFV